MNSMAMEEAKRGQEEAAKRSFCGRYLKIHVFLRLLAALATLVASVLMGLNKQTSIVVGFAIKASSDSSPAFKFYVIGNGIVCAYLFVSLPLVSKSLEGCAINILDLLNLTLLMASTSAATAIAYVGKFGNQKIGWTKVCPFVEDFCQRSLLSLAFSYAALLLFFSICALSISYRTRSIPSQ